MKIDLLKLKGAMMRKIKGKTATKRCLIIPVDDCEGIYLGEKGCYLGLTAFELREPKFNDTHCIKPDIPKDKRDAMSEEQKKAIPILGGLHAVEYQPQAMPVSQTLSGADLAEGEDDLPF